MTAYTFLRLEEFGRVLLVTISRKEKLNAMNSVMMAEISHCFRNINERGDIYAVVLTGSGKAFMAGADIEGYNNFDMQQFLNFQEQGREMYRAIETNTKPVIAAVNGYALGGGFEMALACDIVIASANAKFGLPEVKLGLIPGGGGIQKIARIAGAYVAKELLMSGRFVGAEEGKTLRFVNLVTDHDQLLESAMTLANSISEQAPLAVQSLKRLVDVGRDASLETAMAYDRATLANLFHTQDAKEGVAAFSEKRNPRFQGK